ncbi:MAG: SDR family oxidoreductase [Burkholderiales bacterium]|nr:MAG: SDR family oxidoreductase [Burkholderiales bacterium]
MPVALIVGASRGIGLALARQYRADGWDVIGSHRGQDGRQRLQALGARVLELDVRDAGACAAFAAELEGQRLELAVINAGVYGPRTASLKEPPDAAQFDRVMHTNVLAAMRLAPIVAPLLAPARGTLAFVSSRMGSIAGAGGSNGALYRASKAALNMVARLAHLEYAGHGVRVLALHPGWVRTDMGGPGAEVDADESAAGMRRVIGDAATFPAGGFFDFRGQPLAW